MGPSALRLLALFAWCGQGLSITILPPLPKSRTSDYYWPSGRGHVGSYSVSPYKVSTSLNTSLAWSWYDPAGRFRNVPNSANIDDKKNIYLTSLDGIRKFSEDGRPLWAWGRAGGEELPDQSSLYNGAVYASTTAGRIVALDMETGRELWVTKLASTDGNNGWVSAFEDTVITGSDAGPEIRGRPSCCGWAEQSVTGLNATDGRVLWRFQPDAPVWNFMASFAGDGTFTFQDLEGRAYRNRVSDGSLIWKRGGVEGTWTDATSLLGSNRLVYAISTLSYGYTGPDQEGTVSAYRLEDGELVWSATMPRPPNNQPAIGRLAGHEGLSLVQPIGQQCVANMPTDVIALDAATGMVQWRFVGPVEKHDLQKGDDNVYAQEMRSMAGVRRVTKPNPWSAPTIDADGTVFIGSEEGPFYALRDANLDGDVSGSSEVFTFPTDSCFSGSASPAIAPGMMVVANIDTMYVFAT